MSGWWTSGALGRRTGPVRRGVHYTCRCFAEDRAGHARVLEPILLRYERVAEPEPERLRPPGLAGSRDGRELSRAGRNFRTTLVWASSTGGCCRWETRELVARGDDGGPRSEWSERLGESMSPACPSALRSGLCWES